MAVVEPQHAPLSRGEQPVSAYLYEGADGQPHMLVCRYRPKRFLQYRPDGKGGWLPGLAGLVPVPYHLPELLEHLGQNSPAPIYICEGEKDADAARALGHTATCNPMGAGKWLPEYSEWLQGARNVIIVAHDDEPGRAHAGLVARELAAVGVVARQVRGAHGNDLADHLAAGLGMDKLVSLEGAPDTAPVFREAYDFVDMQVELPVPLWGDRETTIVPQGGLVVLAGRPGVGKTTFAIDLACHLAAGLAYPPREDERAPEPWPVPRPLHVAIIENEGPLEMFRDKLGQKLERWTPDPKDVGGWLGVQVWRWGAFSFADTDAYDRVRTEMDELEIDLVIGDPLASMGMAGVGSPAETRDFVMLLRGLGLGTSRAFCFLHHFRERVEKHEDELARISGAWGGHLDTLVTLTATTREDEMRMAFPKLRWGRGPAPQPTILARVYATQAYRALRREDDVSGLEPQVAQVLQEGRDAGEGYHGWRTYTQLAASMEGTRKSDIKRCLEAAPHLFVQVGGQAAVELGARKNSTVWGLASWPEAPRQEPLAAAEPEGDNFPF